RVRDPGPRVAAALPRRGAGVRAFLAVAADPDWIVRLRDFRRELPEDLPRASWTRPESIHVTVRFLGEIAEEAAKEFARRLPPAAARLTGGELPPAGPLLFPRRGRPRTLGIGFDAPAAERILGELAREAESAARALGCEPEERPFRPHVTLARLRDP